MNSFLLILTSIIFFAVPFLNFNLFLLSWFFFIPILYLLEKNRISPVKLGIIFGTISLLTVTYWATPTLVRLTGVSSLISFLTHFLYCLYESIFYILIFVLTSFSIKKVNNKVDFIQLENCNPVSILENELSHLLVFPNPTKSGNSLTFSEKVYSAVWINQMGQTVSEQSLSGTYNISVPSLKSGVYFLTINAQKTYKIFITK